MRIFIASLINSIKRHFRDATPFIMQVLSPIIMVIVLSSALRSNFNNETLLKPINVAVVNEDTGALSKAFVNFLRGDSLNKLIHIELAKDIKGTKLNLEQGKLGGAIEIKGQYSAEYYKDNSASIKTWLIDNDKTTFQILSSIINSWKNNSAAIQIGLKSGKSIDKITDELMTTKQLIIEKPLTNNGKLPKAIDYFSVTMALMTLIFTGYLAMGKLQIDFLTEMKSRLSCTPKSIGLILTGELLGTTLMGFMQTTILVLFTHFVYGANWGNNPIVVFGTLFIMTFFGQMLATSLTLGMKNANAPQGIIGAAAMGFSFLSGGFYVSPLSGNIGKFFLTYGTPISLAQTAIFGSIYGGSSQIIYLCMGILTVLSLLLLALTITFAKRRIL